MAAAGLARRRLVPAGATYVAPLVLFMLLAFNLPIVLMLGWSIGAPPDVLAYYAQVLERPVYLKVLGNTFRIALIATVVCAVLGYPLAYWMRGLRPAASSSRWRSWCCRSGSASWCAPTPGS